VTFATIMLGHTFQSEQHDGNRTGLSGAAAGRASADLVCSSKRNINIRRPHHVGCACLAFSEAKTSSLKASKPRRRDAT
jgi:hypothetical protein